MFAFMCALALVNCDFVEISGYQYSYKDDNTGVTTRVYVSPFEIAEAEVCQDEFERVMGYNPSKFKGADLPVHNVSWFEAIQFCNKKSIAEGLPPCYDIETGRCDFSLNGFRLPTEAEFNSAGRGFFKLEDRLKYANLYPKSYETIQSSVDEFAKGPAARKSLEKLPAGVYDLMGNVWEWVYDYYIPVFETAVVQVNPSGPLQGLERTIKGGSWMIPAWHGYTPRPLTSSQQPQSKRATIGFRVCRTITGKRGGAYEPEPEKIADIRYAKHENLADENLNITDDNGDEIKTLQSWQKNRDSVRDKWLDYMKVPDYGKLRLEAKTVYEYDRPLYSGKVQLLQASPRVEYKIALLSPVMKKGEKRPVLIVPFYDVDSPASKQLYGKRFKAFNRGYAHLAASQGYIAVAVKWYSECYPDYIESIAQLSADHPGTLGLGKWVADIRLLIDYISSLDNVDSERIAVMGHSLGGKLALFAAAFDGRISAAVLSEPGIGIEFSNYQDIWYLGADIKQRQDLDLHQLLALTAPRPLMLIAGDSVDNDSSLDYLNAAQQIYSLYGIENCPAFYNHRTGHTPSAQAVELAFEWLNKQLPAPCGK
ncbi:Serine/threonine-protein kinase pkn1 [Limihaloglobus sulfuriphilus]|uniref:Serine/threonine-protein kinase pkn1 n=1 Tax=Limihaloglobus sulfuriphilus TaxID=1851148 RepID=A0A1Q2MBR7_9BACT|nr:SUMF1/EgtB/PvdO family nonheme iron enzyme [Limihaloglobus sulfuriphilus]AQQ69682.1 Serine/threonine-protein kinase pkn1 [Limihaloglobus sulfuriphilus]